VLGFGLFFFCSQWAKNLPPSVRAVDPADPDTDPDPAFQVNMATDTDPIQIHGFDDQKQKKKIIAKHFFHLF
jgi:hypothetical protein